MGTEASGPGFCGSFYFSGGRQVGRMLVDIDPASILFNHHRHPTLLSGTDKMPY
jgi:hypothetical protein